MLWLSFQTGGGLSVSACFRGQSRTVGEPVAAQTVEGCPIIVLSAAFRTFHQGALLFCPRAVRRLYQAGLQQAL